jgi:hypothetical protein
MKKQKEEKLNSLDVLAKNVREWIASAKGQESIKEVLKNSKEMTSKLCEARKIDPRSLHDPITL